MYQNKLFTLLNTLSQREMTAFQKHLSRHFTRQDIPTTVFLHVRRYYPGFSKTDVHPTVTHRALFPSEPYNRNRILNAYSDIYLQLRAFLLAEGIKKHPARFRYAWMSILKERGLEAESQQEALLLREEVQALPRKEVADYLKSMETCYYFTYLTNQSRTKPDLEALQSYAHYLDTYYAVCRLKAACEMLNLNRQHTHRFSMDTVLPLLEMIGKIPDTGHPLLHCYLEIYQLLATQDERHFTRMESLLTKYAGQIAVSDLHILISYLHNYATPKIRDGVQAYRPRVHRIDKLALQYDVFSSKGAMSPSQFNNIVNVACTLKDFDWAEHFILKQGPYLEDDIRQVTVELAKATFYFEQRLFIQALICLEGAQLRDEHHLIRASILKSMILFERNPEDPLIDSTCTNFEQNLYRIRTRMPAAADSALRFVRIFRLLKKSEQSQAFILDQIDQPGQLAYRDWLLEKAKKYRPKFAAR